MKLSLKKSTVLLMIGYLAATLSLVSAKSQADDPAAPDPQCSSNEALDCAGDGTPVCVPDRRASKCAKGLVYFVPFDACEPQDSEYFSDLRSKCKLKPDVNVLGSMNAAPKAPKKGAVTRSSGKPGTLRTGSGSQTAPATTSGAGGP